MWPCGAAQWTRAPRNTSTMRAAEVHSYPNSQNYKSQTPNPRPQTPYTKHQTLNTKTLDLKPQTNNQTPKLKSESKKTQNTKPNAQHPRSKTQNPKPQTLNPKPQTPKPKPQIPNQGVGVHSPSSRPLPQRPRRASDLRYSSCRDRALWGGTRRYGPTVGCSGGAFSYERGTPCKFRKSYLLQKLFSPCLSPNGNAFDNLRPDIQPRGVGFTYLVRFE